MRGEDVGSMQNAPIVEGSPPHARGRRRWEFCWILSRRITPACAGKTTSASIPGAMYSDHPRMRGEDGSSNGAPV